MPGLQRYVLATKSSQDDGFAEPTFRIGRPDALALVQWFTPDWHAARASVETLAALRPTIAATGHGTPMKGAALTEGLATLVARFDEIAVPYQGRYVNDEGSDTP